MTSDSSPRPYRKIERARREAETRRRITEAAVELHGTVGPANTKITDLAKRAGVSRMTVYNHFPTEVDLFVACSTHWATCNPFPDPAKWAGIDSPSERLNTGLTELFCWYRRKEGMLGKIFRDAPALPALHEVMDGFWSAYLEEVVAALARDWKVPGSRSKELHAALRLMVSFGTWRNLTERRLDDEGAAELAGRMILGTFGAVDE